MLYNSKFNSKSQASSSSAGEQKDLEKRSKNGNSQKKNNNDDVSYQSSVGPVITINNGCLSERQQEKLKAHLLGSSMVAKSGGKYKMKEYLNKCQEIMSGEGKESIVSLLYSQKYEETKALLKKKNADKAVGIEAKLYAFIEDITKKEDDEKDRSRVASKKADYEKLSDEESNGFGFTDNCILRWILMPFTLLFFLTLPRRFSAITFFLSIVWLSALSYVTVWSISGLSESFHYSNLLFINPTFCTLSGDYLGIPPTVSGMTILAAGSAVPDLVTSIIVIKKTGSASMGISAAIASNIFAILLGLGLPWTIRILLNWAEGSPFAASYVVLESNTLPYTSIILLGTIFALYFVFRFCDWAISTRFALICMAIHVLFIVSNIVLEILISANS